VVLATFAKRPLRQRVIALVAAYAIAFAGLIASFVAAQAAAETAAQPDIVICHSSLGEQPAPASQDSNGNLCIKSCVGCITSLAMAIAPTVSAARLPQSAITRLDLPARVVGIAGAKANAHRSRGPPPVL
jgi:hypothetical protein